MEQKKMYVLTSRNLTPDDLYQIALIQGVVTLEGKTHNRKDHDLMIEKLGRCLLCDAGSEVVD
jgi:hypothetical protein